jgi:hypothetical protein
MTSRAIASNPRAVQNLREIGGFFSPIFWELVSFRSAKPTNLNSFCCQIFLFKGVMNCGQRGTGGVGEAIQDVVESKILSDGIAKAMFTLFTHVHSAVNKLFVRCTPRKPLFYIPFLSFFL